MLTYSTQWAAVMTIGGSQLSKVALHPCHPSQFLNIDTCHGSSPSLANPPFIKTIYLLTLPCTGSEMSGYLRGWGGEGHFKDTLQNKPLKSIFWGSNGHVALCPILDKKKNFCALFLGSHQFNFKSRANSFRGHWRPQGSLTTTLNHQN